MPRRTPVSRTSLTEVGQHGVVSPHPTSRQKHPLIRVSRGQHSKTLNTSVPLLRDRLEKSTEDEGFKPSIPDKEYTARLQ